MVLDTLSHKEQQGLVAAFVMVGLVSLGTGYLGATVTDTEKPDVKVNSGSEDKVRQSVSSLIDQQIQDQRQQLDLVANTSENISRQDLSIQGSVENINASKFGSLYRAEVSITGTLPSQTEEGGTRELDRTNIVYVSGDGRYVFQEPTDLEEPREQETETQSSGGS